MKYSLRCEEWLQQETAHSEGEITDIRDPSRSSGQHTAEIMKKVSLLPDDSQHRTEGKEAVLEEENELEKKTRGRKTKEEKDSQTNSQ